MSHLGRKLLCALLLTIGCAPRAQPHQFDEPMVGCYVTDLMYTATHRGVTCNHRWTVNDMPVYVFTEDPDLQGTLEVAACDFNMFFGLPLFTTDADSGGARVEARLLDALTQPDRIGQAFTDLHGWENFIGNLDVKRGLDPVITHLVLLHELGHIFSLVHTEECSIMSAALSRNCANFVQEQVRALQHFYRPTVTGTELCAGLANY